jgi:hypothetical protein
MGIPLRQPFPHLDRRFRVPQIGVQKRKPMQGIFVVGVQLESLLEGLLGINGILRQPIQAPQRHEGLGIRGILLGDFLKLLDRAPQHPLIEAPLRGIADHPAVNPAENAMRLHVAGVAGQHLLCLHHGIAQATRLDVKVGQLLSQKGSARVRLQRGLVVFDGLVYVLRAVSVHASQLGVEMTHGEVVVCCGAAIHLAGGPRGTLTGPEHNSQQKQKCYSLYQRHGDARNPRSRIAFRPHGLSDHSSPSIARLRCSHAYHLTRR